MWDIKNQNRSIKNFCGIFLLGSLKKILKIRFYMHCIIFFFDFPAKFTKNV